MIIPVETISRSTARGRAWIHGVAIDHTYLYAGQDEIRSLLRAYRHLRPKQDDTFGMVPSDSLRQLRGTTYRRDRGDRHRRVSVFMVVGGVVIMNIMLAVVTERTHEIGIRKSVGARRQDILNQFLVESRCLPA